MLGNSKARDIGKLIATPFAKIFIKLGFSPDLVTLFGTLGVVVSSLVFFSQGQFLWGSILFAMFEILERRFFISDLVASSTRKLFT